MTRIFSFTESNRAETWPLLVFLSKSLIIAQVFTKKNLPLFCGYCWYFRFCSWWVSNLMGLHGILKPIFCTQASTEIELQQTSFSTYAACSSKVKCLKSNSFFFFLIFLVINWKQYRKNTHTKTWIVIKWNETKMNEVKSWKKSGYNSEIGHRFFLRFNETNRCFLRAIKKNI